MMASPSYTHLQRVLRRRFLQVETSRGAVPFGEFEREFHRFGFDSARLVLNRQKVMLAGVLFAQPSARSMADHVLPRLSYYHHRSGDAIDIFFAGFDGDWDRALNQPDSYGESPRHYGARFDDRAYNEFRRDLESRSRWQYSGGTDLILANARVLDSPWKDVHLDFTRAMVCQLEKFEDDPETTIPELLERVFRFAERYEGRDPIWELSDHLGLQRGGSSVLNWLTAFLPEPLRMEPRKFAQIAVKDISR